MSRVFLSLAAVILVLDAASCAKRADLQTPPATPQKSSAAPAITLWEPPADLSARNLYDGPWGVRHAPDPKDVYTFVEHKHSGVNIGMDVVDSRGREWSVKQGYPSGLDSEAPVEVVMSRLLSAIGYHQPPVYYLPSFTLKDDWGTHTEPGGRFRLKEETLEDAGPWSWNENPFADSRPLRGLLVILTMANSTDLKDSNNSIYESRANGRTERWYVVRDIGSALGDTNLIAPRKNNYPAFEQHPFILGEQNGYLQFASHRLYAGLVRDRITREDVVWASDLLSRLSERQWQDAFRAGGYQPQVANQFIRKFREKIRQGQDLSRRASAQ